MFASAIAQVACQQSSSNSINRMFVNTNSKHIVYVVRISSTCWSWFIWLHLIQNVYFDNFNLEYLCTWFMWGGHGSVCVSMKMVLYSQQTQYLATFEFMFIGLCIIFVFRKKHVFTLHIEYSFKSKHNSHTYIYKLI